MFQYKSVSDTLEAIVRDINIYKNDGLIVLCGDLNARTGLDSDFIQNDDDEHIPLDPAYIIDANVTTRDSEDSKIYDRDKQLNDICIASRLTILNGRT